MNHAFRQFLDLILCQSLRYYRNVFITPAHKVKEVMMVSFLNNYVSRKDFILVLILTCHLLKLRVQSHFFYSFIHKQMVVITAASWNDSNGLCVQVIYI